MFTTFIYSGLLIAGANAIQYFGSGNPGLNHGKITAMNTELSQKNISIDYVYHGNGIYANKEFGNFLAAANITEGFAYDRYAGIQSANPIQVLTRRQTTACNTRSKVLLGDEAAFNICNVFAGLVGPGGGGALGLVASGAFCAASDTGLPTNCNILWTFASASGGAITGNVLNRYCPRLFTGIQTTCNEKGGDAQSNDYELIEDISQTQHASCDDVTIPCTTIQPS